MRISVSFLDELTPFFSLSPFSGNVSFFFPLKDPLLITRTVLETPLSQGFLSRRKILPIFGLIFYPPFILSLFCEPSDSPPPPCPLRKN